MTGFILIYAFHIAKKVFWFSAHVCAVLIIVACIFDDNPGNNRKKFGVIKNNAIELVASGGHQVSELVAYLNSKDIANIVGTAEKTLNSQEVNNITNMVLGVEKDELDEKLAYSRYY